MAGLVSASLYLQAPHSSSTKHRWSATCSCIAMADLGPAILNGHPTSQNLATTPFNLLEHDLQDTAKPSSTFISPS